MKSSIYSSNDTDSIAPVKRNSRILFELGNNYVDFFNGDGDNLKRAESTKYYSLSVYYWRKCFAKLDYYSIYSTTDYFIDRSQPDRPEMEPGKTITYGFKSFRLGTGRTFRYKMFYMSPNISANYRYGLGEEYFVDYIRASLWGEFVTSRNPYNSIGIGVGNSVGILIKNHFSISIEGTYNYNYEKVRRQPNRNIDPNDFNFRPSRNYSTLHLKLGVIL
ncbi:MAG: hypothetical protein R2852_04295 [Bacteroidia bacterium]